MKIQKAFICAALPFLAATGLATAQEGARDTVGLLDPLGGSAAPELSLSDEANRRAYAPRSPGDSDIGDQLLLLPTDLYDPFTFYGGVEGRWTSNAALTDDDELSDYYWRYGVGATFLPHITGNLYGEVSANYDWYRYTSNDFLDFDNLDARAGLTNVFRKLGDLSVWGRYHYSRLTEGSNELFTDHSIDIGAFKPFAFRRDHFFYASWISEFTLDANPSFAGRHQHSLLGGYNYTPTDKLSFGLYYRFGLYDYSNVSRTDFNHEVGASIDYDITDTIALRLSASYNLNDSDLDGADYEAGTAGGLAGIRIQF